MKTSSFRLAPSQAFTLIELLTVISIIAILMGLLFPVMEAAREAARRAKAKGDCLQIVAAVKAFNAEYGKYPILTDENDAQHSANPGGDQDIMVGDPIVSPVADNNVLFNILRSIDREPNTGFARNPRKIIFFEGRSASNPENPRSGFLDRKPEGGSGSSQLLGCFFDPWGKQYNVIIDTSYDGYLSLDKVYADFSGSPPDGNRPYTGVGAFSLGKDNKIGDKGNKKFREDKNLSDDIISWQ